MSEGECSPRILCLGDPKRLVGLDRLNLGHSLVVVSTAAEALKHLSRSQFAAVVADPRLLRPLAQAEAPCDHAVVLEALNEGVAITDAAGHILWANPAFHRLGAEIAEKVMRFAQRVASRLQSGETVTGPTARYSVREHSSTGQHCDITVSAIPEDDAELHLVAVAQDRTPQVVLQQKISAIEEAGRKLLHLEPEMVRRMTPEERLSMLQKQIVALTRNLLRFDHFCIRLRNPETDRLELVLTEDQKPTFENRELYAVKEGSGITGYVAATGQPYICNDVRNDPRYLPWLAEARSSLTVPLWNRDKVIGTFNVESDLLGAFGQQDLQALEIFSHYVAQALVTLQLLVAEKVSTTLELAADVTGELSEPLGNIIAAVHQLRADYIGHDDNTVRQLDEILRNVELIRQGIRQVTDVKRPVVGTGTVVAPARKPLTARRILVADDEPTIRKTLSAILSKLGARVDIACDGAEAVEMAAIHAYDLVLADIRMPKKNGYEVFGELRDGNPELPIILMTAFGYDPAHSVVKAREKGLKAVLFKPFKIQVLYEEIGRALGIEMEVST